MPRSGSTTWDDLSEPVQRVVCWAIAIEERSYAGTRALLAGIVRSEASENPVDTLLQHFGITRPVLFEALIRANNSRIFPDIANPRRLHQLPELTENAEVAIDEGLALQRSIGGGGALTVPCLFAGLLTNPRSTASLGLQRAIGGTPAAKIHDNYLDYLAEADGSISYSQHLRSTLPAPAHTTAPSAPEVQYGNPWTALALINGSSTSAAGGTFVRLGLRTTSATVLTVAFPETVSEVSAVAAGAQAEVGESSSNPHSDSAPTDFRLAAADEHAVLFRRPSTSHTDTATVPMRLDQPVVGQKCEFACLNPLTSAVSRRSGLISRAYDEGDLTFGIDRGIPTSEIAIGSPVVVDGAIVGMVETSLPGRLRCVSVAATPLFAPDGLSRVMAGSVGGAGSDAVSDVDQLGFTCYVNAFADLIASPHTQPPLTIGIFGSWGSGKSFLLQHIERAIRKRQAAASSTPHVHVVRFNAWEYSATEVMWPGLVRKILNKVDEDVPWSWRRRMWTRVRWNLPREVRKARPQILAFALIVAAAVIIAAAKSQTGLAAAIGAAAIGVGVGGGVVKAASNPVAQWLTEVFTDADYGRQIGYMEAIKHDLETLEARLHEDGNPDLPAERRILILIDDLDRCEPAKAVEVLQAVNLLLNFNSFIVCLGIDARIVTSAIEAHYDGLLGKAGASGYEYLDKIVQIPFRIPAPGEAELKAYIAEQLGERASHAVPSYDEHVSSVTDVQPVGTVAHADGDAVPVARRPAQLADAKPTGRRPSNDSSWSTGGELAEEVLFTAAERRAFEALAPFMRPNPRHVKRLVNVYRLVRALARSQGDAVVLESPGATIRWLTMWAQWPYISMMMMRRYELLVRSADGPNSTPPEGDPVLHLLAQVETETDEMPESRLDDSIAMLRDLLAVENCAFEWDQIRDVRRYTVNFNPAIEEESMGQR